MALNKSVTVDSFFSKQGVEKSFVLSAFLSKSRSALAGNYLRLCLGIFKAFLHRLCVMGNWTW